MEIVFQFFTSLSFSKRSQSNKLFHYFLPKQLSKTILLSRGKNDRITPKWHIIYLKTIASNVSRSVKLTFSCSLSLSHFNCFRTRLQMTLIYEKKKYSQNSKYLKQYKFLYMYKQTHIHPHPHTHTYTHTHTHIYIYVCIHIKTQT